MANRRLLAMAAALTTLAAPLVGAPKPANVPAKVTLSETVGSPTAPATARVRSDGGGVDGVYVDSDDCVQSWYALPKGNFFLRTVTSSSPCGVGAAFRALVLDFSDRTWPGACTGPQPVADGDGHILDACGVTEVADARLVGDKLFSANATALDIPFSLHPDFRNTAFELDFVETLTVTGTGSTRTMTASPTAIADLWQINGRSKTLLGRYRMPLAATVTINAP